jgi:hypothetical protein
MKTLTHVVLPIAIIAAIVAGVTYITNYTPPENKNKDKKELGPAEALKFSMTSVQANPSDWKLRYWNSDYEVGKFGEFYFWFQNINDQPVRLALTGVSCKCAGVEVGVVPQATMANYISRRAVAHFPGMPGGPILDALNVVELNSALRGQWQTLAEKGEISIPGAPASGDEEARKAHLNKENPQFAIVKLKWESKPQANNQDARDSVTGHFVSQLPNANAAAMSLVASFNVVQPFHVYVPGGKSAEILLNNLSAGSVVTREIICWSKTRSELPLSFDLLAPDNYKDCVTWTNPQELDQRDITDLERKLQSADLPLKIRSAYRIYLTVYEQREIERDGKKTVKHLDLGPISFLINVKAGATATLQETKAMPLAVIGVVRGDVRIFNNGESTDGVDFGQSFSSEQSATKKVKVLSERPGLNLELIRSECLPAYLVVELVFDSEKDGRKQWELQVTIPAKSLDGDLPATSKIVLQTNDPIPRRIRIPIRAKTLD